LTTGTLAPSVVTPRLATPGRATLALTGYAPSFGQSVTIEPATAVLAALGFAPTVTLVGDVVVTPATASLATASYAPTIPELAAVGPGISRDVELAGSIEFGIWAPVMTPLIFDPAATGAVVTSDRISGTIGRA
jgi:hypothetical protein